MYTSNQSPTLDELHAVILKKLPATIEELSEDLGLSTKILVSEFRKQLNQLKALGLIKRRNGTVSLPSKEPEDTPLIVKAVNHEIKAFAVPIYWDEEKCGEKPEFEITVEQHGQNIVRQNDVFKVKLEDGGNIEIVEFIKYPEEAELSDEYSKDKASEPPKTEETHHGKEESLIPVTAKQRDVKKLHKKFHDVSEPLPAVIEKEGKETYAKPTVDIVKDRILIEDGTDVSDGQIVLIERDIIIPSNGKIIENIGHLEDEAALSTMTAVELGIPVKFPNNVMEGSPAIIVPKIDELRKDYTHIPFITIDPEDARDFDDAIYAEPDTAMDNPQGWLLKVAIADVSHYVRPGTNLEAEALKRGNTTYMPDTTFPMIPHALSNDICSLRPNEERAAMIANMRVTKDGEIIESNFETGIIVSRARLSYEQVTNALEGGMDDDTAPIFDDLIVPAHQLYTILSEARERRDTLEIDLEQSRIYIDRNSQMVMKANARDDSHRMIEEFMISANVQAYEKLIDRNHPALARSHGEPDNETLVMLYNRLKGYGLSIAQDSIKTNEKLSKILKETMGHDQKDAIHTEILRAQQRAIYTPERIGHFALALPDGYTHFTSPIRRGADLLIHRGLKHFYKLGDAGIANDNYFDDLQEKATHLNECERRSELAEDVVNNRLTAQWLEQNLMQEFTATVTTKLKSGLVFNIKETGEDGQQIYVTGTLHNSAIKNGKGKKLESGDKFVVQATHADPISGNIKFMMS